MKTFRLRFSLDADLTAIIEANDLEAAKEQLYRMDLEDLIYNCCVNNYDEKDIECEGVTEEHREIEVAVSKIEWDIDEEDESPAMTLPTEDELKVTVDNYRGEIDDFDIEEAISDTLSDIYGYAVKTFSWKEIK